MDKNLWPVKIAWGGVLVTGRATGGTPTTLIDTSKNFETNTLKGKYIKVIVDGVEYVREITANTANTYTFAALVAAVAATAIIEKTGAGKVTITATPEGTYANGYQVVVVQGEGPNAETTATFDDGVLTITLGTDAGTAASTTIGEAGDGQIGLTFKQVGDLAGSAYVALNTGADKFVTLAWDGESLAIGLGTDADGLADDTKNTAALIAAQINTELGDVFTATEAAAGVVDVTAESAVFVGGADPAINATAADVVAEVDALEGFSAVETAAGLLVALENPVQFAGGVDEVKPVDKTEYCIVDGSEKFTDANPGTVQLSGSNVAQGSLHGALTVGTTATRIKVGAIDLDGRHSVLIVNPDPTNHIYVGFDDSVTTTNGIPVYAGQERLFKVDEVALYAIAGAETGVRIAEVK